MTETNGDILSPAKRETLRRMALWALLGAASGAVAWGVGVATGELSMSFGETPSPTYYTVDTAPGLTFGLVIGLALFARGYARLWQAALFAALSAPAWYAGFYVGGEFFGATGHYLDPKYLAFFVTGVVGGTVWAIVQTLAVVPLSFARRVRPLATLVAVGAVTAGLLTAIIANSIFNTEQLFFLLLWTGWYAAFAAVLSLFLPWPESEA